MKTYIETWIKENPKMAAALAAAVGAYGWPYGILKIVRAILGP